MWEKETEKEDEKESKKNKELRGGFREDNTTYLKPSQHCLRGVISSMAVVGFRFISIIMLYFYLFYWFLDVFCLLWTLKAIRWFCWIWLYTCMLCFGFILVFLIPLANIWCFAPSLNLIIKDHALTLFWFHLYPTHWSLCNAARFHSIIFVCACSIFLHFLIYFWCIWSVECHV